MAELRETVQREVTELQELAQREVAELRDTAARETAQVRATAQRASDEIRSGARMEADALLEAAETRARDLARNAEMMWRERRRLIEDMRSVGDQLVAIGEAEGAKRFARFGEDGELALEPEAPSVTSAPADEPVVAVTLEPAAAAVEETPPV